MRVSLRPALKRLALVAFAALVIAATGSANAAAPPAGAPAPAFQRMDLGGFEITAISDGIVGLDVKTLLLNVNRARLDAALGVAYVRNPVRTSDNAYLVNTGAKLVLIDAGAGVLVGPTLGNLVRNLKAAGYRPEDIDEVYLTHLHPDHAGGLVAASGTAVFVNAVIRVDKREAAYWLSAENRNGAPAAKRAFFDGARKSLAPYIAAGHFKTFAAPTTLTPGISALRTPGHTPGHTSYIIASRGRKLIVWGDIVHVAAVQFADPEVAIGYDNDPRSAIASRKWLFAAAADEHMWVADEHISFPGLGHVVRSAGEYQWIPANYEPVIQDK